MTKHYIAMAGLCGYMPNYCAAHETKGSAAEDLGTMHELSGNAIKRLRRDMYVSLDIHVHGNEYAEIVECECDDADCHNEY